MIPSKKPTAEQIKADKIGKAVYNPVLKDVIGSCPTLEQVAAMINEPTKSRGVEKDFAAMVNKKYRTSQTKK